MRRTMQIDVVGPTELNPHIIECALYADGRCCKIYMSKGDYTALIHDGIFIRDGQTKDSADRVNTTNLFLEKE